MHDNDSTPNLPVPRDTVSGYHRSEIATRARLAVRIEQLRAMADAVVDRQVIGPRGHVLTISEVQQRAHWAAERVDMDEVRGSRRHFRVSRSAKLLSLGLVVVVDFPIMLWLASSVFNVDWSDPLGLPLAISVVISVLATGGAAAALFHLGHDQRENKDDRRQLTWSKMSAGAKISLVAAIALVLLIAVVMFVRVYSEGVLSGLDGLAVLLAVLVAFVMLISAGLVFWTAFLDGSLDRDDLERYSQIVLTHENLRRTFVDEADNLEAQYKRLLYSGEDLKT